MSEESGEQTLQDQPATAEQERLASETAQLQEAMIMQLAGSVAALAPAHLSEQQILQAAKEAFSEQVYFQQHVLPTLMDASASSHPTFLIKMRGPDGSELEHRAPKRVDSLRTAEQGLRQAFNLAFLLSPVARALLRLQGFEYRMQQTNAPLEPAPRIILSGRA